MQAPSTQLRACESLGVFLFLLLAVSTALAQVPQGAADRETLLRESYRSRVLAPQLLAIYEGRLRNLLNLKVDWIDREVSLTADQRAKLQALVSAFLQFDSDRLAQPVSLPISVGSQSLPQDFPGVVPLNPAGGRRVIHEIDAVVALALLDQNQLARFQQARELRLRRHAQFMREMAISRWESELFLTTDQRRVLLDQWAPSDPGLGVWFYPPQGNSAARRPPADPALLQAFEGVLSPEQKRVLEMVQAEEPFNRLEIKTPTTMDDVDVQLNQAVQKNQLAGLDMLEVRLQWLMHEHSVPAEAIDPLRLAGKGATRDVANTWRESIRQMVLRNESRLGQGNGTMGMSTTGVTSERLTSHELWQAALTPQLRNALDNQALGKQLQLQGIRAGALTSVLDEELWLSEAQFPAIANLVNKTLPANVPDSPTSVIREAGWLAYPLLQATGPDLEGILTPQQIAVWKDLSGFYVKEGEFLIIIRAQGISTRLPWLAE